MRNENLELAQSSGSESSPTSWASYTPRATNFNFDFGQSKTIDDLTNQLTQSSLRPTKSSEVLSEPSEDKSSTPSTSSSHRHHHHHHTTLPSTSRKTQKFGSGECVTGDSVSTGAEERKHTKESKIAKFLRRTQSASVQDEPMATASTSKSGESSRGPPLGKIDDTEEEIQTKKRNKGTDMKFRLGFLKRRHTEGTINSSSVRPQPEEAQKWANSFSDLMSSKYGQALFKAFLQREFSEENVEFWLAVEDYRKTRQNKLNNKAKKIFDEFIIAQAPKEVNLDSITREGVVAKMAQPTISTFDQAQKRVQGVLEADAYSRFLKSDLYLELVHPDKYRPSS